MKKLFCEGYKTISVVILFFAITIINFSSCQTTEPPAAQGKIMLEALDASSTEAWLKLSLQELNLPQNVTVTRNDTIIETLTMDKPDTVIYDEGLLPSTNYNYKAELVNNYGISAVASIRTMDTTSHDFTWQTFTFGGANGSSVLNDVAIINENDIWAVGEIHTEWTDQYDSNGVWVQPYNAVHWDGNKWELRRIIVNFRGNATFIPLEGIFAFSSNDIWLVGSLPIHGDGNNWKIYDVREITNSNLSLSKAWGESSANIYFVGRGGPIAHYDGSRWEKIESGTDLRFHDINGDNEKIYCIATELFTGINSELFEIKNSKSFLIDGTNLGISSVTVYPIRKKLYVFGYYRFVRTEGKGGWEEISEPVNFDGYSKVIGIGYNDIVAVGSFGKVYHYNGISWNLRRIGDDINNLIDFTSVAIKSNIICAVGSNNIALGRR